MAVRGRKNGDDRLALELAAGKTVADAAAAACLSQRTAYRRLDDPQFCGRLARLQHEMIAQAVGRLAEAATKAADRLVALLDAESETVRLGAARSILEHALKRRESESGETPRQHAANGQSAPVSNNGHPSSDPLTGLMGLIRGKRGGPLVEPSKPQ
jgi:soluble lytic murein transglycosylase-like protein